MEDSIRQKLDSSPSVRNICARDFHIFVFDRDGVIKWKHFPRYWPFVGEIHKSPANSPHKANDAEL